MPGIWDELGVAPTTDAAAIRRAYAARLKAARPDADPQGFARLRDAYEHAMAATKVAAAPLPCPAPPPAPPSPPRRAPDPMAAFLRRGDARAAAEWLAAARMAGTLTLAADLRLADRLGWAMAQDRTMPAQMVREAAGRLGWPDGVPAAAWAGALRARLDAERWLEGLRRTAASRTRWLGAAAPVAARTLLGQGRLRTSRLMASDPRLRLRYGEYLLHASVIADQFDAARIEAIGRLLTRRPNPLVERVFETLGFLVIAGAAGAGAGSLAAALDPRLQDGVTGAVAIPLWVVLLVPAFRRRLRRLLRSFRRR